MITTILDYLLDYLSVPLQYRTSNGTRGVVPSVSVVVDAIVESGRKVA